MFEILFTDYNSKPELSGSAEILKKELQSLLTRDVLSTDIALNDDNS